MRALVVDDEPIARRRLKRMLERIAGVEVVGEAADGEEARQKIDALAPDVVLLDIRMPGLDGLSLALERRGSPPVVFTTAHAEFAVEAFAAEAVDYLLKPIEQPRLEAALARVARREPKLPSSLRALLDRLDADDAAARLTARRGGSAYFFDARRIARIRADLKYASFVAGDRTYLLDDSLDALEARLGRCGFVRVHRAELVNSHFVRALHRDARGVELELEDGTRVRVSRRRAPPILARLGLE